MTEKLFGTECIPNLQMTDLATIVKSQFQSNGLEASLTFDKITQPTPLQQKALDLLEVSLICTQ